jgi:hypothetical protein
MTVSHVYGYQSEDGQKPVSEATTTTKATSAPTSHPGVLAIPEQQKQSGQPAGPSGTAAAPDATSTAGPMPPLHTPLPSPPSTLPQNGVNSIPPPTPEKLNEVRKLATLTKLIVDAAEEDRKESAEKQKWVAPYRQWLGVATLVVVIFIALVAWRGKKIFSRNKQAN